MTNFFFTAIFSLIFTTTILAQVSVSPNSITAYSQGATSAYLTFSNVVDLQPAEATWCGEILPAAPDIGFKCDPATIFGVLPARYDQSRLNGTRYTDIISITPTVARRAYTDAVNGNDSRFFYVRRFIEITNISQTETRLLPIILRWKENSEAKMYRLEIENSAGKNIFSAVILPPTKEYRLPSFIRQLVLSKPLKWRVLAVDEEGKMLDESKFADVK
ncbi:hypothetical protein BH20ACI1_BH20ACI1_14850 [soil metagenome]